MQVRFRYLSILFFLIAFSIAPSFLPISSKFFFCSSSSWGAESKKFGENGRDGSRGKNGQRGQDSDNLTIFADGSPMTLDLSGANGGNGESGTIGGNSNCNDRSIDSERNLQGADGGSGGDGGDGGDGGNGGSLTIYTANPEYLKQIYISAAAGKGGESGQGGAGGQGCQCQESYSTQQVCNGNDCTPREFKCQDGLTGSTGRGGRSGRSGNVGRLTLIKGDRTLDPDRPTATVKISEIKDRGLTLSKNIWETRTGATTLFAPNSILADEYTMLIDRLERSVLVVWDAPRPFKDFADTPITFALGDWATPRRSYRGVEITPSKEVWFEARTQERENITEVFISNALNVKEVTQLKSQGLSGRGNNLSLNVTDAAEKSDLILTDFTIKYRINRSPAAKYRPVHDYDNVYEGKITPEMISYNNNNFAIELGKLPIKPEFLKPGLAVEVELIADRSFAGRTKQQKLFVREVLK
ncbi:MAG: collagen-like protein [Xenococcaceae cyanobacterium]